MLHHLSPGQTSVGILKQSQNSVLTVLTLCLSFSVMLSSLTSAQICWKSGEGGKRGLNFLCGGQHDAGWVAGWLCLRVPHLLLPEEHHVSGKPPPAAAQGNRAEQWARSPCAQGPSCHRCRGAAAACPCPQQTCRASPCKEREREGSSCQGVLAWRKAKLSSAAESILHRCCLRNPSQMQYWSWVGFFSLQVNIVWSK